MSLKYRKEFIEHLWYNNVSCEIGLVPLGEKAPIINKRFYTKEHKEILFKDMDAMQYHNIAVYAGEDTIILDYDAQELSSLLHRIDTLVDEKCSDIIRQTLKVKTAKNQWHIYLKLPSQYHRRVRSYIGRNARHEALELRLIDVRGYANKSEKQYVIGAGSYVNGNYYKMMESSTIELAPPKLIDLFIDAGPKNPIGQSISPTEAEWLNSKILAFETGQRNLQLFKLVAKYTEENRCQLEDLEKVLKPAWLSIHATEPWSWSEAQATIKQAWRSNERQHLQVPASCVVGKRRSQDIDTFSEALEISGIKLRHNTRTSQNEWRSKHDKWQLYRNPTGGSRIQLMHAFSQECSMQQDGGIVPFWPNKSIFTDWVSYYFEQDSNRVDPFLEWLMQCDKDNESSESDKLILESWLEHSLLFESYTDVDKWISWYIPVAAAKRALSPGAKADIMPVLYGEGGSGKSSTLERLVPDTQWYTDSVDINASQNDIYRKLQTPAIVEFAELVGFTKVDITKLKRIVSSTVDDFDIKYQAEIEKRLRTCIFVGTTDKDDCLPIDENLRRFVMSSHIIRNPEPSVPIHWLHKNRDRIWAAAYREAQNCELLLPSNLKLKVSLANQDHIQKIEDLEPILKFIPIPVDNGSKTSSSASKLYGPTMAEILVIITKNSIGFSPKRNSTQWRAIRQYLLARGCKEARIWRNTQGKRHQVRAMYVEHDKGLFGAACDKEQWCMLLEGHENTCQSLDYYLVDMD